MHSRFTTLAAWLRLVRHLALLAVVSSAATSSVLAEEERPLFGKVGELILGDGTSVSGPVALSTLAPFAPDIAVVGAPENGEAYVFERSSGRDDWQHTATLMPSDGATSFGRSVAVDGLLIVVGADDAAYVFERVGAGASLPAFWQQVARFTGDQNAARFGTSVAVSGSTVVVGAPVPRVSGPEFARVFEQDRARPDVWHETATLSTTSGGGFGTSVAIDLDTIVVGSVFPSQMFFPGSTGEAQVFSRHQGGDNAWGPVAVLPLLPFGVVPDCGPAAVVISGDTLAIAATCPSGGLGWIFQRDRDEPNAWLRGAQPLTDRFVENLGVSRDMALVSAAPPSLGRQTYVFARNKGAANAWGPIARLTGGTRGAAISGDTVLLSNQHPVTGEMSVEVYVSDVDRDGIRDDADPCPRDPLNSLHCQRTSAAHPVVDEFVALTSLTVLSSGNPFVISAMFTNQSQTALANPFFEVTELTGGNLLLNVDGGSGGVGGTRSPDVGDGVLLPGESMTVEFVIQLDSRQPFRFFVQLRGDSTP